MRNTTTGCRKVVIMLVTISFVLCLTVQGTAQVSTDRMANIERPVTTTSASDAGTLINLRVSHLVGSVSHLSLPGCVRAGLTTSSQGDLSLA
jgi:hypothetical protein